ncbi:amidohydrolase family protein [Hoeflea prorocentri]|uniref:Amidohydrolase family protein n=1 Tax=Hoeflea prorocentri TaxID=1922333 RepID=A0A9X3ZH38_9HYPH|nr:amidohydrolase family protein [Hoeflea prorocentri]MCY6380518.1 amidohydrolase family protein [Hoeflea prorocentri]MDA5398318.1 amidohydrolase family protein [Hoeflea prorocentri]
MTDLFDAHFHIFEPGFPMHENNGYLPQPFTLSNYDTWRNNLHVCGGAVVSGSMQGFDTSYLLHALAHLGPGFVGVAQIPPSLTDEEILALDREGVRAVRFNVRRGGSATLDQIEPLGQRVFDLAGWHVELYIDAKDLPDLMPVLSGLPKASIDHLGLSEDGLPHLLRLVERGVKVKATGFGRLDFDPLGALRKIHDENPHALMFGTDLPSTRAKRPFRVEDVDLVLDNFSTRDRARILRENAAGFYGISLQCPA